MSLKLIERLVAMADKCKPQAAVPPSAVVKQLLLDAAERISDLEFRLSESKVEPELPPLTNEQLRNMLDAVSGIPVIMHGRKD